MFCVLATQLLLLSCFECFYHIAVVRVARVLLDGCQGVLGQCLIVYYYYHILKKVAIAFLFLIQWHKRASIAG